MSVFQAILLGAIQGATEFLPVSSSGHLLLARELVGVADIPVLFDVLLHVATLFAVIVVLRRRIGGFLVAIAHAVRSRSTEEDRVYQRLLPLIIGSTAITGVVGIGLDQLLDIRSPVLASAMFLVTAGLLMATRWTRGARSLPAIGWLDALILGLAQGFGVLPGISRSGITISTALFRGLDRKTAGEFSFLLSIPAILGALVLTARDLGDLESSIGIVPILLGCVSAAVVGYIALRGLLRLVQSGRLAVFAVYLIPLGVWGIVRFG